MTSVVNSVRSVLAEAADGKYASCLKAVSELDRITDGWRGSGSVYVLRNVSLEGLEPFLKLSGYEHGLKLDVRFSDYDAYQTELLDPASSFRQTTPDLTVLALWLDNLPLAFDDSDTLRVDAVFDHVAGLVEQAGSVTTGPIAVNTFLPPIHGLAPWAELDELNQRIRALASADNRLRLIDFDRLQAQLGVAQTVDRRFWFQYKAPAAHPFLRLWAHHLGQIMAGANGGIRKVLVLDCDNTLWGGIVGEDGLAGIRLSSQDGPGVIFDTFQRQVLALQRRGVLVALCSKNNEADVFEVLDSHPHCRIKREDLAAWRVNWDDKAANMESLARELNLGLDSFVFVDDSATECDRIRQTLPMVDVLQVPEKLHELPGLLPGYLGFGGLGASAEDVRRTRFYKDERQRKADSETFTDLTTFLASLDLSATVGPVLSEQVARVAQLTQKTNQFNLTTRRYNDGEIAALASDPDSLVMTMSVADKYGDYGLTGVAVVRHEGDLATIENLLMSCRILGRKLETVFLGEVQAAAMERWPVNRVAASYRPTAKNSQVARFYEDHGFTLLDEEGDERRYQRAAAADWAGIPYIQITRRN